MRGEEQIDHVLKRVFSCVCSISAPIVVALVFIPKKIITAFNTIIILIKFIIEIIFTSAHRWCSTHVFFLAFSFFSSLCAHIWFYSFLIVVCIVFSIRSILSLFECGRWHGFCENQQEENRNIKTERMVFDQKAYFARFVEILMRFAHRLMPMKHEHEHRQSAIAHWAESAIS